MSRNKNRKFDSDKFKPIDDSRFERSRNNREEKKVKEDLPKIVFSFKDFDVKQIPPGQSYDNWQENELLAYMLQKFGHICEIGRASCRERV